MIRRVARTLFPTVLLVAGVAGCFATREDVATLQSDMQAMRAATAHSDSVRRVQWDSVRSAVRVISILSDSLEQIDAHILKWQGDVRGDLYSIQQELLQVQELTGQSGKKLQDLRAQLEARGAEMTAPPPQPSTPAKGANGIDSSATSSIIASTPSGSSPNSTNPAPGGSGDALPGPDKLFQAGLDQLRRGSTEAARSAFSDLLTHYPTADVAGDAQFYIGESFKNEGTNGAADSVYQIVVSKYPDSPHAPTALYRHALTLKAANKTVAAKAAMSEIVQKYPNSDEAVLAKDQLRTL